LKILLTGATGYVGSFLLPVLEREGHQVAALLRKPANLSTNVTCVQYNGLDELAKFCDSWSPDAIIHLAADTSKTSNLSAIDGLLAANITLPLHLAAAAKHCDVKCFINVTTFSTAADGCEYFPQTLYAATKKATEDLLTYFHQSEGLKVCNLVFYDVYGPNHPHSRFLNSVMEAILHGTSLSMTSGQQDICFVNVLDAVEALVYCLRTGEITFDADPALFSVHGPEVFKVQDVPKRIASVLGKPLPNITSDRPYRKNEIMIFAPRGKFPGSWRPRISFEQGISQILAERNVV
jgi:nucleoside-diphosphate-sugar epimerase